MSNLRREHIEVITGVLGQLLSFLFGPPVIHKLLLNNCVTQKKNRVGFVNKQTTHQ